jgi:hypothetical protein
MKRLQLFLKKHLANLASHHPADLDTRPLHGKPDTGRTGNAGRMVNRL